ncbi:hypothetical protein RJ641_002482 [Dillenia turbinata]|uniref:Uncharacterized protein n=1 Tax=Dillenia turbinata TaxID=194707 RepID=A0AAN8VD68_9MAGN
MDHMMSSSRAMEILKKLMPFKARFIFAVIASLSLVLLLQVSPHVLTAFTYFWPLFLSTGLFLVAILVFGQISVSPADETGGNLEKTGEGFLNYVAGQPEAVEFPDKYRSRRSPSRSISRSPHGYRGRDRSRSLIRSPSPLDRRPSISDRLKSRLGPRVDEQNPADKVRPRSRSRSQGTSSSRSSDAAPPKRCEKVRSGSLSRSRSSSPAGQKGLVSYGDGSPDTATSD